MFDSFKQFLSTQTPETIEVYLSILVDGAIVGSTIFGFVGSMLLIGFGRRLNEWLVLFVISGPFLGMMATLAITARSRAAKQAYCEDVPDWTRSGSDCIQSSKSSAEEESNNDDADGSTLIAGTQKIPVAVKFLAPFGKHNWLTVCNENLP